MPHSQSTKSYVGKREMTTSKLLPLPLLLLPTATTPPPLPPPPPRTAYPHWPIPPRARPSPILSVGGWWVGVGPTTTPPPSTTSTTTAWTWPVDDVHSTDLKRLISQWTVCRPLALQLQPRVEQARAAFESSAQALRTAATPASLQTSQILQVSAKPRHARQGPVSSGTTVILKTSSFGTVRTRASRRQAEVR